MGPQHKSTCFWYGGHTHPCYEANKPGFDSRQQTWGACWTVFHRTFSLSLLVGGRKKTYHCQISERPWKLTGLTHDVILYPPRVAISRGIVFFRVTQEFTDFCRNCRCFSHFLLRSGVLLAMLLLAVDVLLSPHVLALIHGAMAILEFLSNPRIFLVLSRVFVGSKI